MKRGLQKDTHKVWTLGLFFPKHISLPFLHKMLIAKVSKRFVAGLEWVFPFFILFDFSNNSVWCLTLLWIHTLLINSTISEGPVYASFNLGQCLNVTLLDLVAVVVSLLTSCNIQTPSNIQRRQMRLRKNVNYCLLNFIISLTLWKHLEPKKRQQN